MDTVFKLGMAFVNCLRVTERACVCMCVKSFNMRVCVCVRFMLYLGEGFIWVRVYKCAGICVSVTLDVPDSGFCRESFVKGWVCEESPLAMAFQ